METHVFFGDSLTRADYLEHGFVDILAERWRDVHVLNYGVNGDTAGDLLDRVDEVVAERPDWVWLMIGTNDCGWGVPVDQYAGDLANLVSLLSPARVVLITPTASMFYRGANAPYVGAVKELAALKSLPVIDFAAAIEDSYYGPDGLHWNEAGHRRLAEMVDDWWKDNRDI